MIIPNLFTAAANIYYGAPPSYINTSDNDPPPYSRAPSATATMTESTANATNLNYKCVQKINGSIKDRFTIDPFIQCETGGKENLLLETRNGEIDADVTLIGAKSSLLGGSNLKKCTNLVSISHNGGIRYKLRKSESESTLHPPFLLKLHSFNGKVRVSLPSKFSGVIEICALNGAIKFPNQPSTLRGPEKLGSTKRYRIGSDSSSNDDKLVIKANNGEVEVGFFDDIYIEGETAGRGIDRGTSRDGFEDGFDRMEDFGRHVNLGGPTQESGNSSGRARFMSSVGGTVHVVADGRRGQSYVGNQEISYTRQATFRGGYTYISFGGGNGFEKLDDLVGVQRNLDGAKVEVVEGGFSITSNSGQLTIIKDDHSTKVSNNQGRPLIELC